MTAPGGSKNEHLSRHWPAPGKLNLFLHVLGRRPDGYHELETAFQFLDWSDNLDFRVRGDGRIERRGWVDVDTTRDLALRAARLLQSRSGTSLGAEVALDKHLPVGGGLGGGSSDAATTLTALNRLWECGLGTDELARLGLELGADVPVFLRGHAAIARGVGERLEPAEFAETHYLVIDPGAAVSTAAVFGDPELTRNSAPTTIAGLLSGGGRNDCEPVVRRRYPVVAEALDWLASYGEARLTGTGGCVFAAFPSRQAADRVAALAPSGWQSRVARGLNRSPLRDRLAQPL